MFKDIGKNIGNFIDKHPTLSAVATGVGFFGVAVSNQAINQAWNNYSNNHGYENHLMFKGPGANETFSHQQNNTNYSPATWEGLGWNLLANAVIPIGAAAVLLVCKYMKTENEGLFFSQKEEVDAGEQTFLVNSDSKNESSASQVLNV